MKIDRIGKTAGRWPNYQLIVNGVDLGTVRRTVSSGYDLMGSSRYDGWAIHGTVCDTRDSAESKLIERAVRFGLIT